MKDFKIFSKLGKEVITEAATKGVLRNFAKFSCEFCEISKNAFYTEYLWTTASVITFDVLSS